MIRTFSRLATADLSPIRLTSHFSPLTVTFTHGSPMNIPLTETTLDALKKASHIPPDVQREIAAIKPEGGTYRLHLSDDEGMELAELLQWHVRTDPATGKPTAATAPYAEIIRLIGEAQS